MADSAEQEEPLLDLDHPTRLSDSDDSLIDLNTQDLHLRQDGELEVLKVNVIIRWYARFLTRFPYILPIVIVVIAAGCGVYSWKHYPLPDFSEDPTTGFETRGTPITADLLTWTSLEYDMEPGKSYSTHPNASLIPLMEAANHSRQIVDRALYYHGNGSETAKRLPRNQRSDEETCQGFVPDQPKVVFAVTDSVNGDLLNVDALQSMCHLQDNIITDHMPTHCPMLSLSYYVTLFANTTCSKLTEQDVMSVRQLFSQCLQFYYNQDQPGAIPESCIDNKDRLIKLFYYILPKELLDEKKKDGTLPSSFKVKYSLSYIQTGNAHVDWQEFYSDHVGHAHIQNGPVKVAAVYFNRYIKFDLFEDTLLDDLVYFGLAAGLVLIIMMLYLRSIVLTLATIINIGLSLIIAYTIYFSLPKINFFPFFNLLSALILIAVGADDVFIFQDTWDQAKEEGQHLSAHVIMAKTFSHAAASVFVTSFTTAAAFFTNTVSVITDIQCFGIFAGICILTNFVLMITWTPSVIVCIQHVYNMFSRHFNIQCNIFSYFTKVSNFIYCKAFPCLIDKLWFLWIFLFVSVGICGCIVVFVKPKLQLPNTKDFQVFHKDNPLEQWSLYYQDKFQAIVDEQKALYDIDLTFVWGFVPEDSGNQLDPYDVNPRLNGDKHFDFYAPESQQWLLQFCHSITNASFIKEEYENGVCDLELYGQTLSQICEQGYLKPQSICCQNFTIPYNRTQLKECAPIAKLHLQTANLIIGEPIFDTKNTIVGYKIEAMSNLVMSGDFEIMDSHYKTVDTFVNHHLETAPQGMKSLFFTAGEVFHMFYDLQKGISEGTYYSVMLSIVVAFGMMLLTSLNVLITVYAIVTIAFAIICTVASLVLLGWHLNVVESMTISLAVGLSIDFTIHYGVAYRLSEFKDSKSRTKDSFKRVGCAVAMAALTTFLAGSAVMQSSIDGYTKMGTFLMLVMAISWTYSTFLFQSICHIIGPRGNFCQISMDCLMHRKNNQPYHLTDQHNLGLVDPDDPLLFTEEAPGPAQGRHFGPLLINASEHPSTEGDEQSEHAMSRTDSYSRSPLESADSPFFAL